MAHSYNLALDGGVSQMHATLPQFYWLQQMVADITSVVLDCVLQ